MSKARDIPTGKISILATNKLECVGLSQVPELTLDEFTELKYGGGKAEVHAIAAEWLIKFGHAKEGK
jgi:hypothetical protein